jgi:hypothetical protein
MVSSLNRMHVNLHFGSAFLVIFVFLCDYTVNRPSDGAVERRRKRHRTRSNKKLTFFCRNVYALRACIPFQGQSSVSIEAEFSSSTTRMCVNVTVRQKLHCTCVWTFFSERNANRRGRVCRIISTAVPDDSGYFPSADNPDALCALLSQVHDTDRGNFPVNTADSITKQYMCHSLRGYTIASHSENKQFSLICLLPILFILARLLEGHFWKECDARGCIFHNHARDVYAYVISFRLSLHGESTITLIYKLGFT